MTTLEGWLSKVAAANSSQEIFQLLNEFRKGEWTDEECSLMSRTYINVLGKFDKVEFSTSSEKKEKADKTLIGTGAATSSGLTQNSVQAGNDALDEIPVEDEEVWYEKM